MKRRKPKTSPMPDAPDPLRASSANIPLADPDDWPPAPPPTPASPPPDPVVVLPFCPSCEADAPIPAGVDILTEQLCDKCEAADVPEQVVAPPGHLAWVPDDSVVIRRRDLAIVAVAALLWGLLLPDVGGLF